MEETPIVRIVDIARMAGVSIGTVDRVLHNRGRVSEKNRRKIEEVLARVNYQPNLIARSLVSKRVYRLVVIIPAFVAGEYWEQISQGIDQALVDFHQYHVQVEKVYFDQFDEASFLQSLAGIQFDGVDGVLLATLYADRVRDFSKELDRRNIPYVYIDSDIADEGRMAFIGTDSLAGGRIAARLLSKNIQRDDDILIARIIHTGAESTQAQSRQRGFLAFLEEHGFQGRVYHIDLFLLDQALNEQRLDDALARHSRVKGAVIFNSKAYVLGEYLKAKDRRDICLVGYDLIERNERLLCEGYIEGLIAQHPRLQGYEGVRLLCDRLILAKATEQIVEMPLDILIKENYYYHKLRKF